MQEESERGIYYKINENSTYKIHKRVINDRTFYNIYIAQTKYDGTKEIFSRQVKFAKCNPPEDEQYIKINCGFESDYIGTKDPYNPIMTIVITDYEVVESPEKIQQEAFAEYNQKTNEIDGANIEITDDMIPF